MGSAALLLKVYFAVFLHSSSSFNSRLHLGCTARPHVSNDIASASAGSPKNRSLIKLTTVLSLHRTQSINYTAPNQSILLTKSYQHTVSRVPEPIRAPHSILPSQVSGVQEPRTDYLTPKLTARTKSSSKTHHDYLPSNLTAALIDRRTKLFKVTT